MKVVIPRGAPQQSGEPAQNLLDKIARDLYAFTEMMSDKVPNNSLAMGFLGGTFGYGVNVKNDVFMMHPYCWCEREDCKWCAVHSSCEEKFFVDDKQVDSKKYSEFITEWSKSVPREEWAKISERARFERVASPDCMGCEMERPAPNFECDGVQVWWYKFLGRGMKVEPKDLTEERWREVYQKAVASVTD